jgi:beta-galactosidase
MRNNLFASLALSVSLSISGAALAADTFVWLEGEQPAASNVEVNRNASAKRSEFLSDGKWLLLSIDAEKVQSTLPADGALIDYTIPIAQAGAHEVWVRIGLEFVRSPFEWRIDDGPWAKVSNQELTSDLMELDFWNEVAWLRLSERQDLSQGEHRLQFHLTAGQDEQGKPARVIFALDAICLSREPFHPYAAIKPGQDWRDDQDRKAAQTTFALPEADQPGQRTSVKLEGLWEIARHDEQLPKAVAEPIRELPEHPYWRAIQVPGDKNKLRPDMVFAHRLWYRTRVQVPASLEGRSFYVEFPQNNLNTTVYVNGEYCGFFKDPFARFRIDVTKGIRPGEVNEVWVGIRDAWYGRTSNPDDPMKLRRTFNYPLDLLHRGFQDLDYPIWNSPQSGLLSTPTLVAAGSAYVDDVFIQPSVKDKQLRLDLSLRNNGADLKGCELVIEAVDDATGRVERTFAPQAVDVGQGADSTQRIMLDWADARLWWPEPQPSLYRLRTTLRAGGKAIDVREDLFGFREWRADGTKITLNGINWPLWADLVGEGSTPEKWLAAYRAGNQRLTRLATAGQAGDASGWMGMSPDQALEFFDRSGVVVRRNSTLDGEAIGYHFSEADPKIRERNGGSEMKVALMKNWQDQCVSQIRGERNHPSIALWSIENEFAFINLINLLGSSPLMDQYEAQIQACADACMAADPTRLPVIDGGGALKLNTLPVHGDHYVATLDSRYPDLAYEPFVEGGGRGRWTWDMKRPRYIGEDYFATGINPADYATWGGEIAFQGKAATREAVATCYRMLQEGYRWGGYYAGWHLWLGSDGGPRQRIANAPRAALVRQWDWTFGSGQTVTRTFGLFNDSRHDEPITFTRTLHIDGKPAWTRTTEHRIAPGTAEKFDEQLAMPTVEKRQEAELLLTLSAGGEEVFRDSKAVSILPPVTGPVSGAIALYDPSGEIAAYLKGRGVAYTAVSRLDQLPDAKVLIVGRDALSANESTSTRLAAHASAGKVVIVLDQAEPLYFQAIPAEMELAPQSGRSDFGQPVPLSEGRTAFIEDTSHPALKGLLDKDFFTWGPAADHVVYRNAYVKPTRGGKSLLQVGPRLAHTALAEVPVGQGALILCQANVGRTISNNAVAQQLLANLIAYAGEYKLEFRSVAAVISDDQLAQAVDATGLQYTKLADPLAAISGAEHSIALISATPQNLKTLAANPQALADFWKRGGQIVLHGLTPDGLADFDRIVGVEHVIRPFRRERVTFPAARNPLTAGLTTGDIVMLSGQRIFGWTADEYVASDVFTQVVDLDDIAPFCRSSFASYDNITNGFVGSDGWPLIIDFPYPADGKPFEIPIDLPAERTIIEFTHDQSVNYSPTTKIALRFGDSDRIELPVDPGGEAQTYTIDPPRKTKRLTLEIVQWQADPSKAANIGIDNINIRVQRPAEEAKILRPMLNVGGLVQYAHGSGGVVLCNLNFQQTETVPINKTKKRTIVAAVLRNLKAPFAGGKTIIAGAANLSYAPIDISHQATQFRDERGWFGGDKAFTFRDMPSGSQRFAEVPFDIYQFATSPVPNAIMLRGSGVPNNPPEQVSGIPVNRRADAIFFLHAARIDQRANDQERREGKRFELARYVVHYADGQMAEVPVLAEIDVDEFRQESPRAIAGAQIGWTTPYAGTNQHAVSYIKQWNNPRPDVQISSIDITPGEHRDRGVPVLLAITAATAEGN